MDITAVNIKILAVVIICLKGPDLAVGSDGGAAVVGVSFFSTVYILLYLLIIYHIVNFKNEP